MSLAVRMSKLFITGVTGVLSACSPLQMINRLTPTNTYKVTQDIRYQHQARGHLDVYAPVPKDGYPEPAGGYPVVLFIYG